VSWIGCTQLVLINLIVNQSTRRDLRAITGECSSKSDINIHRSLVDIRCIYNSY